MCRRLFTFAPQKLSDMIKIVILDGYSANPGDLSWQALETIGEVTVYDRTRPEETVERAKDAEIVLTNKVCLRQQEIDQLPQLRYIGVLATGYNVVDLAHSHQSHRALCYQEQGRGVDCLARLLLLGHTTHGDGWQDLRYRGPWQYRAPCGCRSPGIRHEGGSLYQQACRSVALGCRETLVRAVAL